jgi:hypothetical protein
MQIELREFRILRSCEFLPLAFTGRVVLRGDGSIEIPAGIPEEWSEALAEALSAWARARVDREATTFKQEPFTSDRAGERIVELREADIVEDPREIWLEHLESLSSGVRA